MADLNAILDSIKELKLLEVAELVKMMEEEFGVSAAAPVMVAAAGAEGGAAAADRCMMPIHWPAGKQAAREEVQICRTLNLPRSV